jgi:hypothetical protein
MCEKKPLWVPQPTVNRRTRMPSAGHESDGALADVECQARTCSRRITSRRKKNAGSKSRTPIAAGLPGAGLRGEESKVQLETLMHELEKLPSASAFARHRLAMCRKAMQLFSIQKWVFSSALGVRTACLPLLSLCLSARASPAGHPGHRNRLCSLKLF